MECKQLLKIKARLEKQNYLTSEEKELLAELQFIDGKKLLCDSISFSKSADVRALSGPGDNCPCCGRRM